MLILPSKMTSLYIELTTNCSKHAILHCTFCSHHDWSLSPILTNKFIAWSLSARWPPTHVINRHSFLALWCLANWILVLIPNMSRTSFTGFAILFCCFCRSIGLLEQYYFGKYQRRAFRSRDAWWLQAQGQLPLLHRKEACRDRI